MSNKNASQVVIPLGGEYHVAPDGTPIPSTVDEVLAVKEGTNAAWRGLGWVKEDGAKISQEKTVVEIPAWGSNGMPIKKKTTGRKFNFGGTLLQSNAMNVTTWFGSTDFATDGSPTGFRADIEVDVEAIERAMLVSWTMDGHTFALPFKKVDISADGDLTIVDNDAQQYGLTISSLVPDVGDILGHIITDHPAFDPAA